MILIIPFISNAYGANPNLYVSAENSFFNNYFAGSTVVEVVVKDPSLMKIDGSIGEPDVTINGKNLRMAQATDGNWYAYFANIDKAKTADQIVLNSGTEGNSLDFGIFCSANTDSSVLGTSFSDTEGVAIPKKGTLTGFTNGVGTLTECTGTITSTTNINNVVRNPKSLNTNSAVSTGQIGININAWPLIQLFSFNDVEIQYNRAGGTQQVDLEYDEISNIKLALDRDNYPKGAKVFVTITDAQLNQDPTNEDSWTFNINSTELAFYRAFTDTGSNAANGGAGLINLIPHLSSLDFKDNGKLTMDLGSVAELKTNDHQPSSFVSDGTNTFSQIVTIVETQPNSGIFENYDKSNDSTIGILSNSPRGQAAIIDYNSKSTSILSIDHSATISTSPQLIDLKVGIKTPISINDSDQNIDSGSKENFDVFRSSAIIPTIQIGNPITLEKASSVKFYNLSTDALTGGTSITSSNPDTNSNRLIIDTTTTPTFNFEKISLNLGITNNNFQSLLIDSSISGQNGTNWINFDLRSFEQQLGLTNFNDSTFTLYFGSLTDPTPITIIDAGDISSGQKFIQLDDSDVTSILSKSGNVFLVINFDSSNDSTSVGTINSETDSQPIVFDLFSFGENDNNDVNNSIYRFELEETSQNSGIFSGTMEATVANQINIFDADFISTLRTIDDDIKFFVTNRLIDEEGISINYADVDDVGVQINQSMQSDVKTHSGMVSTNSPSYKFGQTVKIILNDQDLNLKNETIESYSVIDTSSSSNVDTIGTSDGDILLEIKIKDIRYQRCTVNGIQYGGLSSSGFILVETSHDSGIFEGIFKLPTRICNDTGTALISTAGGSIKAEYYDFRDKFGKENIFNISNFNSGVAEKEIFIPNWIKNNAGWWSSGDISDNDFTSGIEFLINDGIISVPTISSEQVSNAKIPDWLRNNANWWSQNLISDEDFANGIEYLIINGIIEV